MPLEPKFQRRRGGPSLPRPFVDRQEHLDAFWNSLHRSDLSQPRVLVFHGLGGIGKSRLRKELRGRLAQDDPRVLWAEVDFSLPTLRDPETALFSLRRQFSDGFGVRFPTFDLAYAYLWKLARPNIAPLEEGRPFFVAGTLAASFLSSVGVPLVSFVANAVEKGNKPVKAWWTARGRDDLKELSRLDPPEIEQRLPAYLAEDLSDHLGKRKLPGVIFLDTHEALLGDLRSEEQRLLKDAWLRELVLQLPSVLFVIFGREELAWGKLDPEWEAVLEQRQIEELLEQDARSILSAGSLTDPGLQDLILKEAMNVPFLLDLTLDTIEEMKRSGKEFGPEELAEREPEAAFRLAERFLRYLFPAEQDTVEVLAIPRFFDESLFKDLVAAFQTQLPLGQFREICRFSFMNERSPGIFQMHDLMRECLETRLGRRDSERRKTVHVFLFHRYDQRLEGLDVRYVGPQQEQAFSEAFHHAPEALGMEETVKWFERRSTVFFDASRWRLLLTTSEELLRMTETTLGPNHPGTWDALAELAWILQWEGGKYEEAETLLRRAIGLCEQARGKETQSAAPYLARLAHALLRREYSAEAEEMFRRSVSALEVDPQRDNHAYCLALYGVALCCQWRGLLAEAENGYRQALEVAKRANDVQQGLIMLGLCQLYGVGGSYEKADEAYRETYDFFVSKYSDTNHHVAMLQCDWGDLQMRRGCYNEAEALFQAALETMKRLHIHHPEFYGACRGNLGEVYLRLGRYDEAKSAFQQSLCELDDSPGRSPLLRSWMTRTMGLVHLRQGQLEEAERLLDEARRDSKDSETPDIQDPAGYLLALAELRRHQQRFSEAEEHLREALELVETNLRPDHPQAGEILLELAALREEQGRGAEASDLRTRAQRIRREAGCVS